MTKITPTIAQTEKDSNTRRSDKVYNFEKPRNPYDKPKNITSSAATEIAKSLITQEKQVIQNKANKLLESITYTGNARIVLGKIKKETKGRTTTIGPISILDFPPTLIQIVDKNGMQIGLENGYIYLIAVPEWNEEDKENDYTFTELELPGKGTLLPSNTIFQKTPNTWEEIGALIEKYQNALL